MCDPCRYCASERVVPVLDKRIEQARKAGNKYRTRCLNCSRWLPMTSAETFENHRDPHVLPADADPDEEGSTVSLVDYDYADETAALAAKVSDRGIQTTPARTDGGEEIDADDDAARPVEEHQFACPATGCGATLRGFPTECGECGAGPFEWPDNAAERWRNGELD